MFSFLFFPVSSVVCYLFRCVLSTSDGKKKIFINFHCRCQHHQLKVHWNPSQSYGASTAIWNHMVLTATRHK